MSGKLEILEGFFHAGYLGEVSDDLGCYEGEVVKREIIHFADVAKDDEEAVIVEDFDVFGLVFLENVLQIYFDEDR